MVKQQTALAKQNSGSLAERPDYLKRKPGQPRLGSENVTQNDIIVPRLAISQATSWELKKSHAKYIAELEQGQYFNTVTKEIYGDSIRVLAVHFYRTRIRWGEEMGAGFRCQSDDAVTGIGDPGGNCAACEFSQRGIEKKDGPCTLLLNFPLFVIPKSGRIDPSEILIYPMKSLAISQAKHWNSLNNIRNGDRFEGVYRLTVVEDHRESGDSFQPHIDNDTDGWATPEQLVVGRAAYDLITSWKSQGRRIVTDAEQEAGTVEVT
jgi:hypothetical protein